MWYPLHVTSDISPCIVEWKVSTIPILQTQSFPNFELWLLMELWKPASRILMKNLPPYTMCRICSPTRELQPVAQYSKRVNSEKMLGATALDYWFPNCVNSGVLRCCCKHRGACQDVPSGLFFPPLPDTPSWIMYNLIWSKMGNTQRSQEEETTVKKGSVTTVSLGTAALDINILGIQSYPSFQGWCSCIYGVCSASCCGSEAME